MSPRGVRWAATGEGTRKTHLEIRVLTRDSWAVGDGLDHEELKGDGVVRDREGVALTETREVSEAGLKAAVGEDAKGGGSVLRVLSSSDERNSERERLTPPSDR